MLEPNGRVVMVSGASRGIGRAVALKLASSGFKVSAGVRDPKSLEEGENLSVHFYDADKIGAAEAWVDATIQRWGGVDGVVNAAGIHHLVKVFEDGEEELDEMWRVNVMGPLRVIRAAVPHLEKSGIGRVVNIASNAGKRVPNNVGYSMTKFAVVALNHGVRREGWERGIRSTAICPGLVNTDMAKVFSLPPEEMSQPEDIAALVETALCVPNNAAVSELVVHCQFEPML
ncbi:MAG: SDR family NAD(P)-dependent oxidoreductase [Geminicoccaceae bacterium]|nr:SDR family NAD(P)-dependent oxidoreductase [Geminicoccaceae bacterium]MCB9943948.1 SDR family NAD(P)-dependent oxidoreductase [Geminicoccaceae bacterium]